MGDPHYNTWGGKNNSWGNRNRKNKSNNTSNRSNNSYHYEPTKLFNTLAGGMLLALCGIAGISIVGNLVSGIGQVKEVADTAQTIVETANNAGNSGTTNSTTNNATSGTGSVNLNIKFDIDIDAQDVADIIQHVYEQFGAQNIKDTLALDFNDVKELGDYTSKIVNKLDKYNNFLVVSTESLSEEENKQLQDKFNQMVTDNVNLIQGSGYNCIERNVQSNKPGAGNFIISITYLHVDR